MTQFVSTNEDKVLAFEFVLKHLLSWNKEVTGTEENNDLSILKAIKLLFFVTAVNTKDGGSNVLLNNVFDDFVAMPYGHVESDIYDEIRRKQGKLNFYQINNSCTVRIAGTQLADLEVKVSSQIRKEIIDSVSTLKKTNFHLIKFSAFELVDLSHSWYSWKKTISKAKQLGLRSMEIENDFIVHEDKIFSLQNF